MSQRSFQQLIVTNYGLHPSGYAGSRGDTGAIGYTGSAAVGGGSTSPTVTAITYPGNDTAADTAGGQTITLTGTGFASGATVVIDGITASVVTVVNSTTITFTAPAVTAGSYIVYVINTNGTTALLVPGIQYSGIPTWTTPAGSLGSVSKQVSFTANLTATGDAPISYNVYSGALPSGLTLTANTGVISGTTPNVDSSTTYNFTIRSTDAQLQDTDRAFSITVLPTIGVEYLVVAGGGGGGFDSAGGGGGGGLLSSTGAVSRNTVYTITIGAGGTPSPNGTTAGGVGGNTSISGTGISTTTYGGGGGSNGNNIVGINGGSGGGTGHLTTIGRGVYPGSTYISGPRQGYDGALGFSDTLSYGVGGGGGGAGAVGSAATSTGGGAGGIGVDWLSLGTYYGGGGGGAGDTRQGPKGFGAGGTGGGGRGSNTTAAAIAGSPNTGGGGGGGPFQGGAAAAGGSGVVVLRYADTNAAAASTTGSPTVTTAGGYRIYRWTTSGSVTF